MRITWKGKTLTDVGKSAVVLASETALAVRQKNFPMLHPFLLHAPIGNNYQFQTTRQNAIVIACVSFLTDAMLSAPIVVRDKDTFDIVEKHPALDVLRNPNQDLDWIELVDLMIDALINDGLIYLHIRRTQGNGRIYIFPHLKENTRVNNRDSYTFTNAETRKTQTVPFKDVKVLRYRKGRTDNDCSPIRGTVIDEINTDSICAAKTRQYISKNIAGSPYLFLKPEALSELGGTLEPSKLAAFRETLRGYANSENGEPVISDLPLDVTFQPSARNQIDFVGIRKIAEARICGAVRVRPEVCYAILGMESTRVGATMTEAIRESWEGAVMPLQNRIARKLTEILMPMFPNTSELEIAFDNSEVTWLTDDERAVNLSQAQLIDRNEGRALAGFPKKTGWDDTLAEAAQELMPDKVETVGNDSEN